MNIIKNIEAKIIKKNKIYIVPSKQGFIFLGINFTLFLIGLTYANNFTLLICFILFIFFLLTMFQTHQELEELANFELAYTEGNLQKHSFIPSQRSKNLNIDLRLASKDYPMKKIHQLNEVIYKLEYLSRGIYQTPKIKIYTNGDYNLFYVWSYRQLNYDVILYPIPIETEVRNEFFENKLSFQGSEEFNQYQLYSEGMSSQRIDWKVYARSDQLYSKKYDEKEPIGMLIKYDDFSGEREIRISHMAFLVEHCSKGNIPFALEVDDHKLNLGSGEAHATQALQILAGLKYAA